MIWTPFASCVKGGVPLSIYKRFALYLSIISGISVILLIAMISWVVKVSPAINAATDATTETIASQFIAMGYIDDSWSLSRPDPYGNRKSEVKLTFSNKGILEKVTCDTAYVNTNSVADIYADIQKSVEIMGGALDTQKADIIKAIEDIRAGGSVHAGGDLENGGWGVGSNTYDDKQGGKLRYVCFSAWMKY